MLTLEEIKEKTLWVARMCYGGRYVGTYDEVKDYLEDEDCKDLDIVCCDGQPKELQEFYRDYDYAVYKLHNHNLFNIDDFYEEWSKNPNQFKPIMRPVIDKLSNVLENREYKNIKNWRIENYDLNGIGNHYKDSYVKALKEMECDFDVVSITPSDDTIIIMIQSTDNELVEELTKLSNEYSIRNRQYYC